MRVWILRAFTVCVHSVYVTPASSFCLHDSQQLGVLCVCVVMHLWIVLRVKTTGVLKCGVCSQRSPFMATWSLSHAHQVASDAATKPRTLGHAFATMAMADSLSFKSYPRLLVFVFARMCVPRVYVRGSAISRLYF